MKGVAKVRSLQELLYPRPYALLNKSHKASFMVGNWYLKPSVMSLRGRTLCPFNNTDPNSPITSLKMKLGTGGISSGLFSTSAKAFVSRALVTGWGEVKFMAPEMLPCAIRKE